MLLVSSSLALLSLVHSVPMKNNKAGAEFIIRPGSEVVFYSGSPLGCSESFMFPGGDATRLEEVSFASSIKGCDSYPNPNVTEMEAFMLNNTVTAKLECSNRKGTHVWVVCHMGGVAVSRRAGQVIQSEFALSNRVACEATYDEAVRECAASVYWFKEFKSFVAKYLSPSQTVQEPVTVSNVTTASPTTDDLQESEAVSDVTSASPTTEVPITDATSAVDQASVPEDEEARKLTQIKGTNLAGKAFQVLDDGLVRFSPEVGHMCTESHLFDGVSTNKLYNAVDRTSFVPCASSNMAVSDIDSSWVIVPKVDCSDPVYISIHCDVTFNNLNVTAEMSRRAILQVSSSKAYLSSRIGCGIPDGPEMVECASLATNYMSILNNVPIKV